MKTIHTLLVCLGLGMLMTGCVSTARVSDFPKSADELKFDELAMRDYNRKDALWNEQTAFESFLQVEKIREDDLVSGVNKAMWGLGFETKYSDQQKRALIFRRGLRAHEWSTVAGIYYHPVE